MINVWQKSKIFMDNHIKTLHVPNVKERVIIIRRDDGAYTYIKQWWDEDGNSWGPPGPSCGIYDSVETAEAEARQKVDWLKGWSN
jgi:hypothetical protein